MELRLTQVTIDDGETPLDASISGNLWNGFQMPYFTPEQAKKVAETVNGHGCTLVYDEAQDAYLYTTEDFPDEPEVFGSFEVNGVKYYAIGAGSWCWDLFDPDNHPFAGDFNYHARKMLGAAGNRLMSAGFSFEDELVREVLDAASCVSQHTEAELRDLIRRVEMLFANASVPHTEKMAADIRAVVKGGNPWEIQG